MTTTKETMWLIVLVIFEGCRMAWEFVRTCWRKRWPVYGLLALALGVALMFLAGCTQPEIRESGKVAGSVANSVVPGSGWLVETLVAGIGGALLGGGTVHVHHKRKQKRAQQAKGK